MDVDHVRVPAACIGCVTADDVQAEPEYRAWIVHVHPECPVHGELVALRAEARALRTERDAALNLLEGYAPELTRRLRDQMTFERARATEGEP